MKGSFLWKLMFLFCALAGCLAGYGYFHLVNEGIVSEYLTEDNTLVRESENSVFFDAEKLISDMGKEIEDRVDELMKKQANESKEAKKAGENVKEPEKKTSAESAETVESRTEVTEIKDITEEGDIENIVSTEEKKSAGNVEETIDTAEENKADAAISTAGNGIEASPEEEEKIDAEDSQGTGKVQEIDSQISLEKQEEAELAFTYPAEIFGQVPVINRSDAYVTYFEFAHDLIELVEPEVKRRDMNETALFAQFALKAFFCGVKIQNLDINAPITRKEAALTLWLAADVMGEDGSNTSARSAENYATDVKNCSGSEKKAIAYLYEQRILSGYQIGNQTFEPDDYLTTEIGENWLIRAGQCWK